MYSELEKRLENSGFKYVYSYELNDLEYGEKENVGYVAEVEIKDTGNFKSNDKFKNNNIIKIRYHSLKTITIGISSED